MTDGPKSLLQAEVSDLNLKSPSQRRFYEIAGITIKVESDILIRDDTFAPKFKQFQADRPGRDSITLRHHFGLPDWHRRSPGREVYNKPPWIIYRNPSGWTYVVVPVEEGSPLPRQVATFNDAYTETAIFSDAQREEVFRHGTLHSLTGLPTDQIFLVPVLADRQGCFLHAAGAILNGKGLVFAGQAGAGKSTTVKMLQSSAEILCDDRVIVRLHPEGFMVHGTWDHGEVPQVSPSCASLRAIFFLQQSSENQIIPLEDPQVILGKLLARLVKPPEIKKWWDKTLPLVDSMVGQVRCYDLQFDLSGRMVQLLEGFSQ